MAVENIVALKARFNTDDVVDETSMVNLIDSCHNDNASGSGSNADITDGADLNVSIQHGGNVSSLAKLATEEYRVTIPANGNISSMTVHGGPNNVNGSNELSIKIKDTDGALYRMALVAVIAKATNERQNLDLFPVTYALSGVGEMDHVIGNLQLGASGFILIFQPAISYI